MKQPEDSKTMELPLAQRGRGRPKLEHALSQAERAKRYRDNKRAKKNSDGAIVTQNEAQPDYPLMMMADQVDELERQVVDLTAKVEQLTSLLYKKQLELDTEYLKKVEAENALSYAKEAKSKIETQWRRSYDALAVQKAELRTLFEDAVQATNAAKAQVATLKSDAAKASRKIKSLEKKLENA
ncbi:hypothetical protein [Pseudoduganella sp. R-34]|uniref:hypothetical protein n=1 Tax=Pseudoduganella sp. R-34 TaxID=3404062 RepID=UPI003CF7B099